MSGHPRAESRPIIGGGFALLIGLAGLAGACVYQGTPDSSGTPRVASTARPGGGTPSPTGSAAGLPAVVYVLTPLGVNLREAPDPASARITTVRQSVQLDVTEGRRVGSQFWLHVRAHQSGVEGWVLNDPELVIDIAVSQAIDTANGVSLLFPSAWTRRVDDPTTTSFLGPATGGETLIVQVVDDPARFRAVPTGGGQPVRDEQLDVYGRTVIMTVYRTPNGFEMAVKVRPLEKDKDKDKRQILFLYQQFGATRTEADPALFKKILSSVVIAAAG